MRAKFRFDLADAPATDYHEACDHPKVALLPRGVLVVTAVVQRLLLVFPEQAVWLGRDREKNPWFVLAGNAEAFAKHGAALKWRVLKGTLAIGAGGAILLDAAYPAKGTKGSRAKIAIAPGDYRIEVASIDDDRGELHAARLTRLTSRDRSRLS